MRPYPVAEPHFSVPTTKRHRSYAHSPITAVGGAASPLVSRSSSVIIVIVQHSITIPPPTARQVVTAS
jgi:hypothetical protein